MRVNWYKNSNTYWCSILWLIFQHAKGWYMESWRKTWYLVKSVWLISFPFSWKFPFLYVHQDLIDERSLLILGMAWCLVGNKPLMGPVLTKIHAIRLRQDVQSSAVITRFNIVRYYIYDYSIHGRISVGKLWGVFCEYLLENWPCYYGTAL